jgi:hypothetical protein
MGRELTVGCVEPMKIEPQAAERRVVRSPQGALVESPPRGNIREAPPESETGSPPIATGCPNGVTDRDTARLGNYAAFAAYAG